MHSFPCLGSKAKKRQFFKRKLAQFRKNGKKTVTALALCLMVDVIYSNIIDLDSTVFYFIVCVKLTYFSIFFSDWSV